MAILETLQYEDDIKKLVDVAVVKMKQYEQTSLGDGLITDETCQFLQRFCTFRSFDWKN